MPDRSQEPIQVRCGQCGEGYYGSVIPPSFWLPVGERLWICPECKARFQIAIAQELTGMVHKAISNLFANHPHQVHNGVKHLRDYIQTLIDF